MALVGRVIDMLPDGEPVRGMTTIDNCLYVLRANKSSEQIEVYDVDSFSLLRCISVPGLANPADIVACEHNCCVYICSASQHSVHKVLINGTPTQWPVNDSPTCLSLTVNYNVLVACRKVCKIKEFTTDGQLLRDVVLNVLSPWHAVQLSNGELIVCHGYFTEKLHRVCLIDSKGRLVKSYGGQLGSGNHLMNTPSHMAVDENDFVFVVDRNNFRVLLLSPTLTYVREVLSPKQLQWQPYRVSVDVKRRRLYVAVNEHLKVGDYTAGRVIVVNMQ